MIVEHKKGDFAGTRCLGFAGWCPSYWEADGWHDSETGELVANYNEELIQ